MAATAIPAKRWRHVPTGRTASAGGACPWRSDSESINWVLETVGWTIRHPDGTTGIGRPPFATQKEAEEWIAAHPNFRGMSQG